MTDEDERLPSTNGPLTTTPAEDSGGRTILDWALFYVINGFSVIPLNPRSKEPNFELLKAVGSTDADGKPTWKPYVSRRATKEELEVWFKDKDASQTNIGIVAGFHRAILDIDDDRYYRLFFDAKPENLKTWVGRPSKGYHVYLALPQSARPENVELPGAFEFKTHDKYVACPPSLHPSGPQYKWVNDVRRTGFLRLSQEDLTELTNKVRFLRKHWAIIKAFSDIWSPQHRHNLSLGLCGLLRKRGFALEDAMRIIWAICTIAADPELNDRLTAIKDTYAKPLGEIAGASRLREELETIVGGPHAENILSAAQRNATNVADNAVPKETDPEIRTKAERLLEDPAILNCIHNAQGEVQGEDENKVLLPILVFAKQSFEVQGETAAGKNTIVDSALSLFPEHWSRKITGLTDKSLRHLGGKVRTLYFAERRAMRTGKESTVEYDIKIVISEGKLKILTTVPDHENPKKFKTEEIETEIENVVFTSTEFSIPQELQNRIWVLRVDDSKEQNIRVRDSKLTGAEKLPNERPDFTREKRIIQAAFAIAEEEAPKYVVIPYATLLKPLLDEKETRVRRDTDKIISVIKGIARILYRQRSVVLDQTDRKVVVSSPEDFWLAWRIGSTAIKETFTDMTERDVRVLHWCKELSAKIMPISAKDLAELTGRNGDTCQKYLRALQVKGFLLEEGRGPHGLKLYSLHTPERDQPGINRIPTSEMKTRYENWIKGQSLRSETGKIADPALIDPITGLRAESMFLPFRSEDLNEKHNTTSDSGEKEVASPDSDLTLSKTPSNNEPDKRDVGQIDLDLAKAALRQVKGPMTLDYAVEQVMKKGLDRPKAEDCVKRLVNDGSLAKDPEGYWRLVK